MSDYRDDPRWQALRDLITYEPPVQRDGLDTTLRTLGIVALGVMESVWD